MEGMERNNKCHLKFRCPDVMQIAVARERGQHILVGIAALADAQFSYGTLDK